MPVWLRGGIGPIQPEVLAQGSGEPEAREITWVYTPDADLPREAFFAGENENYDEMFIGRTVVDGDMIPGMIVPNTGQLIFSNKGVITTTDEKQVLCGVVMKWMICQPTQIHHKAVIGGRLANGQSIYIGMTTINGKVLIGHVDPSKDHKLFVPYEGRQESTRNYKILIAGI